MHVQYFDHPFPTGTRVLRLGISENWVYVYIDNEEYFDFYRIDVRFPYRWQPLGRLNRGPTTYEYPVLSLDGRYIYVLGLTSHLVFEVYRKEISTGFDSSFTMVESDTRFQPFQLPLDQLKIRCGGENELVFYDRSIVQGDIPFWSLKLCEAEMTFEITRHTIGTRGDSTDRNSALFPVLFDPAKKMFAKLMSPRKMLVYIENQRSWLEYTLPAERTLVDVFGTDGFPVEEVRNIRETYGSHGHRVAAMQTRLTFHDMDGDVVARVLQAESLHKTAQITLDHVNCEIRVKKLATFQLSHEVSRMFYPLTSPNFHVFLGVSSHAVVFLRSPSFEELTGWYAQQKLLREGHRLELQQVSNYNQLVALAIARDGEGSRVAEQNLRNLGIFGNPVNPLDEL